MKTDKLLGFSAVLLLLMAVSCSSETAVSERKDKISYKVNSTHESEDGESTFQMHSTTPVFSFDELGDMAELVILGEIVSETKIKKRREYFSDTYPIYLVFINFKVAEYLKGSGPDVVRVAVYDTEKHPSAPKVDREQRYVLYLNRAKNEDDSAFYDHAYRLGLAHQGVWAVSGGTATQHLLGKSVPLDDLRKTASTGFDHKVLTYENFLEKSRLTSRDMTLSINELAATSSIIVQGSPVGEAVIKDDPKYPSGYSQEARAQDKALLKDVKVFEFNISRYYKGDGPATINVFTDGSAKYPFIDEDTPYVLYLYEADFDAARAYYGDAYVIVGAGQGTWVVGDDGKAARQLDGGKTIELSELDSG